MTIITNDVKKNECVRDLIKTDESFSFKSTSNGVLQYISQYLTNLDLHDNTDVIDFSSGYNTSVNTLSSRYTQDLLGAYQLYAGADRGLVEEREEDIYEEEDEDDDVSL